MDYTTIKKLAIEVGFDHAAPLDPATIVLKEEVRQMCAACSQYAKRWSCPPGCGTLEEGRKKLAEYRQGVLVQTVGKLEDEFDGEGMMEAESIHKERFHRLCDLLQKEDILPLGAGCCTICSSCTYPDAPCRFPDKMVSSMEACGMVVAEVCKANSQPYHYGKNTITYTCCVLFDKKESVILR